MRKEVVITSALQAEEGPEEDQLDALGGIMTGVPTTI